MRTVSVSLSHSVFWSCILALLLAFWSQMAACWWRARCAEFTCTPHRLHCTVSFLVSIFKKIGRCLDVPSASKNSKGLAPGFKIQSVTLGCIRGRQKRVHKNYEDIDPCRLPAISIRANVGFTRSVSVLGYHSHVLTSSRIIITKYGWYRWIWLGSWWTPWNREGLKSWEWWSRNFPPLAPWQLPTRDSMG